MMKKNLKDYVKLYKNFIDKKFCKDVIESIKDDKWYTHAFYQSSTNLNISHENELSILYNEHPLTQELNKKIWFAIEQYIVKDMAHMKEWFCGWNGYITVRYNRYDVNTKMMLHCDHIHSMFDGNVKGIPILSVLGALNNDYEGGELIMFEDTKITIPTGSVLIFPSNFLYPHRVDPVTKGVRYSYVSWVY